MDTVSSKTRSRIMSSVRPRDTNPEVRLRRSLHRNGLRYRLHDKKLPGTPDIVLPKFNAVILVNGCFWHSHGCKYSTLPATNREFWKQKFNTNKSRDKSNISQLIDLGWRVLVVWECALKGRGINQKTEKVAKKVINWLESSQVYAEIDGD